MLHQVAIALFVLRTEPGLRFFSSAGGAINKCLEYSDVGAKFLFGDNFQDHFFAFKVMPAITFFSALVSLLYHLGVMQALIRCCAVVMTETMGLSPCETLVAAGNIFVGCNTAPLLVRCGRRAHMFPLQPETEFGRNRRSSAQDTRVLKPGVERGPCGARPTRGCKAPGPGQVAGPDGGMTRGGGAHATLDHQGTRCAHARPTEWWCAGGGRPVQRMEDWGPWASRTRGKAGGGWAATTVKRPPQQPAQPRHTNDGAPNDTSGSTGRSG